MLYLLLKYLPDPRREFLSGKLLLLCAADRQVEGFAVSWLVGILYIYIYMYDALRFSVTKVIDGGADVFCVKGCSGGACYVFQQPSSNAALVNFLKRRKLFAPRTT